MEADKNRSAPVGGMEDYPGRTPPGNGAPETDTPASDALRAAQQQVQELRDFISYYVSARLDRVIATARNLGVYAVLGVLALVAGLTVITTAVVMVCIGLAMAIAALVGYLWVGLLIVGLLILGGIAGGAYFAVTSFTHSQKNKTVRKYEQRQREQRQSFGHDVRERARNA